MQFQNETGKIFDHTAVEVEEQRLARKYIAMDAVVLELGARYGTVSCAINKNLKNPTNQVSVEPDPAVWDALEANRAANGCSFRILKGCISRRAVSLNPKEYSTHTLPTDGDSDVTIYTLEQVESATGLLFNTLVADCEGFLEQFFDENPKLYDQLRLVIFERDQPNRCNYDKVEANLRLHGFLPVKTGFQSVWKKHVHSALLPFLNRA